MLTVVEVACCIVRDGTGGTVVMLGAGATYGGGTFLLGGGLVKCGLERDLSTLIPKISSTCSMINKTAPLTIF